MTMVTGLSIITLLAVAIAGIAAGVAWRVTAAERARSRARVAALADAIRAGVADLADPLPSQVAWQPAAGVLSGESEPLTTAFRASTVAAAGAVAVLALAGGVLLLAGHDRASTQPAVEAEAEALQASGPAAAPAPLELIALEYDRGDSGLVIRGMVRNPSGGASTLTDLTADVVVVDGAGGLISTSRTHVDAAMITPGAEAPFRVNVEGSPQVARYRISFRAGGVVIPHVDRRSAVAPAARQISAR